MTGVQMTPVRPCVACGAEVPAGARFCSNCGALQVVTASLEKPGIYSTIGVGILVGGLGAALIAGTITAWDNASSAAEILGSVALTVGAVGVVSANVVFADHLRKRRTGNWLWGTQGFILCIWLLAAAATIVGVSTN